MKTTRPAASLAGIPLGFWVVLLLGIFAWAPATYPGYWQGLEGFAPVFNLTSITQVGSGAADFWRGSGSDTGLLVHPLLALGLSPTTAVRFNFILALLLGGSGLYLWARPYLGDRAAGLAGLLYMLLPPVLATIYIRGSLRDTLILGLLPMALAGLAVYRRQRSRSAAGVAVIAIVWMWRTQAGLALLATLLLLLYSWLVERDGRTVLISVVSGLAAALSLWPQWFVHAPVGVEFYQHFLYPHQLFAGSWQVAPSEPGWQDHYPFQLGMAAVALSIAAFWHWRMEPTAIHLQVRRLLGFSTMVILALISLSLGWSAPLWRWTAADQVLTYPWQILLLATPWLALLAGSLPALNREFATPALWTTLVGLTILSSFGYLTTTFTQTPPPAAPIARFGPAQNLLLLSAELIESQSPHTAELQITWQTLQPLPIDYNIFFQAQRGDETTPQIVAQLDTQPLGGARPATSWQPGEILTDTYQLDLSGVEPSEPLRYIFGYYDWRDGTRLPLADRNDDKLVFYGE
jgi:hypothetical protein